MNETDQYQNICRNRFDRLDEKLDRLNDHLFEDNGDDCLQSRINKNSYFIKLLTGIFVAIGTALLSAVIWVIKAKI